MNMSDKELLEEISLKSESAFKQFYERYNRLLYRWAYNRTGSIEMTEECLQNFWISVWLEPEKIKTNEKGVAKNFLLHHFTYRMLNFIKSIVLNESDRLECYPLSNVQDSISYNHIEEEFDVLEINSIISKLIQELPESVREVFRLFWEEDFSAKEIAKHLNIDERTASYKIKGGLTYVRKSVDRLYQITDNNTDKKSIKAIRDISSLLIYATTILEKTL